MSAVQRLAKAGLITPPPFVAGGIQYEVMMGSVAYGVSGDNSDIDLYGFCIPPKAVTFPHTAGHILGFGPQPQRFEQYQQHHVIDPSARGGRGQEYDLSIYSIVKYFSLCAECNPNMIDSLFVPQRCVLTMSSLAQQVRERRRLFLHKGAWHRFKGYAYSQLHKMRIKVPKGKRAKSVAEHGYDVKYAYHIVRLLDEVEQILRSGDIDLTRDRERLKAIRRGEWSLQQIEDHFTATERSLEDAYQASTLRHGPDWEGLRSLLIECLEQHYGSLADAVQVESTLLSALRSIEDIASRSLRGR